MDGLSSYDKTQNANKNRDGWIRRMEKQESKSVPLRVLTSGQSLAPLERPLRYLLDSGVDVLYIGKSAPLAHMPAHVRRSLRFLPIDPVADEGAHNAVVQAAAEFAPDCVHVHGLDDHATLLAHSVRSRPLLASLWGYVDLTLDGGVAFSRHMLSIVEKCDALLVDSPALLAALVDHVPPTCSLYEYCAGGDERLYGASDPAERARLRRAFGFAPDAAVVLSVRGWGPTYDHVFVARAFAQALRRSARPLQLAFVTMGRSDQPAAVLDRIDEMRVLVRELGIEDHVRWLPSLPGPVFPRLLGCVDVVVSWKVPDYFPASVCDAFFAEVPVVSPRLWTFRGSLIEQFAELVDVGDVTECVDAILRSTNTPDRARLAEARRETVRCYGHEAATRRLLDIYRQVLKH
jgi:glycosyltransferase involved in cell wall biosynthesis